jgi:restriction system protein
MEINSEERHVWGIHTMNDSLFLHENVIAIGWKEMGDLREIEDNRDAFKKHYNETYPDVKKGSIATSAGMLYRFVYEVQIGDYIVFPSKIDRRINIGTVEGEYTYIPSATEYVQQRKVKWLKHLPRTAFSQGALYEVGSALSFFAVKNYADEYLGALEGDFQKTTLEGESEDESVAATADDIVESTKDFILKELSKNLKGYDLEEFVADLLMAMGYRTSVSAHGGDSGIDITAYKDELPPRILGAGKEPRRRYQRNYDPVTERRHAGRRLWTLCYTFELYQECAEISGQCPDYTRDQWHRACGFDFEILRSTQ